MKCKKNHTEYRGSPHIEHIPYTATKTPEGKKLTMDKLNILNEYGWRTADFAFKDR